MVELENKKRLQLYRYQLLPVTRNRQLTLFNKSISSEELVAQKNLIFGEILSGFPPLRNKSQELNQKVVFQNSEWLVIKIAARRKLKKHINFKAELIDDWPHVTVVINNDPDIQTIAVTKNTRAFSNSSTVVNLLAEHFRPMLARAGLIFEVEAQFNKNNFWQIIDKHNGAIKAVRFDLVTPNMSSISSSVTSDLKRLAKSTNAQKTEIELKAEGDATLEITQDNAQVNGLLDYLSKGGGNISFRIKGLKKRIQTAGEVKEIEIDELELSQGTMESLTTLKPLLE